MALNLNLKQVVAGKLASKFKSFVGGIGKGKLYGKTADQRPCLAIENPVSISDLHATIFQAMGIAPDTALDVEQRPFYVTEDGKGQPVHDLFA